MDHGSSIRPTLLRSVTPWFSVLVLALGLLLGATGANRADAQTYTLQYSESSGRSAPLPLAGASVSDDIHVFTSPETGVDRVLFFFDDPTASGSPVQSEGNPPYDFAGGSVAVANPFDTTNESDGSHSIAAELQLTDGSTVLIVANFTILNNAPSLTFLPADVALVADEGASTSETVAVSTSDGSGAMPTLGTAASWLTLVPDTTTTPITLGLQADTTGLAPGVYTTAVAADAAGYGSAILEVSLLVVSTAPQPFDILVGEDPARSGPVLLDAQFVSGDIFVFTAPDDGVDRVIFHLDDPDRSGAPYRVENNPPFDFAGGNAAAAKAFDTEELVDGPHSITAELFLDAGGSTVVTSVFTVANQAPVLTFAPDTIAVTLVSGTQQATTSGLAASDGSGVAYTLVDGADWLDLPAPTGITPATVSLDLDASGLAPGVYTTALTATGGGAVPASLSVELTVLPEAPAGLAYSSPTPTYPVGTPIPSNTPSSTGGPIADYSVDPPLPAGLSLDPTSGEISGTPTTASAAADHVVTASNVSGADTTTLTITVLPAAPAGLTYADPNPTYVAGTAIIANVPSSTGGPVTGYSVAPPLPAGLLIDAGTGVISGTPTEAGGPTGHIVTATNAGGEDTADLLITIAPEAPSGLAYSTLAPTYQVGVAIAANTPSSTGGPVDEYTVDPALPSGLQIDPDTGVITGTPLAAAATADHVVTATNATGFDSVTLTTTVLPEAPAGLGYSDPSPTYTEGVTIAQNVPSSSGGAVDSYSVDPPLPGGLLLDLVIGTIDGTPTDAGGPTLHTVTATNAGGSDTATVEITVLPSAPANLTYSILDATYPVGVAISSNVPSSTGGPVESYDVAPALPDGLTLDPSTGVITGAPTTVGGPTVHTVTATNISGSAMVALSITVDDPPDPAPCDLTYSETLFRFPPGVMIEPETPTVGCGGADSFAIDPPLPTGLVLDPASGTISGTPVTYTPQQTHVVTATNAFGFDTVSIDIVVDLQFTFTASDQSVPYDPANGLASFELPLYFVENPSDTGFPTETHGLQIAIEYDPVFLAVDSVALGSDLMFLNGGTGPTFFGPSDTGLGITIGILYDVGLVEFITAEVPREMAVLSFGTNAPALVGNTTGVSLTLPWDDEVSVPPIRNLVVLDGSGGVTPVLVAPTIDLVPISVAPTGLTYTTPDATYTVGIAIPENIPSSDGEPVDSYAVDPPLPGGLLLDAGTGVISGTPTTAGGPTVHTVTATNSGGSDTTDLSITIHPAAPAGLTYATLDASYTVGIEILGNTASSTGGPIDSYSVLPALPAGLLLDAMTGTISGTPTEVSLSSGYTVTATNVSGTDSVVLTIGVDEAPPATLAYSNDDAVHLLGVAITPHVPTVTGGTPTSFSVVPDLPAGLVIDGISGTIDGTPTTLSPRTSYAITAMNGSGFASTTIHIEVADPAPCDLTYPSASITLEEGSPLAPQVPTVGCGGADAFSVDPTLPVGLTLDPANGTISGTPTAAAPATVHTVTASNAFGSATSDITVEVTPRPALVLTPVSVDLQAEAGTTTSTTVDLAVSDGSAVTPTFTGIASWLTVTPGGATTPMVLTLDADATGLIPGSYSTTINASAPGVDPASAVVSLIVTAAPSQFQLLWSDAPDRSGASHVAGQVLSGDIHIFTGPDDGVERVIFHLDDTDFSEPPFRTENNPPFDLAGGSVALANPIDTSGLSDGAHTISAILELTGGGTEVLHAPFIISNSGAALFFTPPTFDTTLPGNQQVSFSADLAATDASAHSFALASDQPWLVPTTPTGSTPATVDLEIDTTGLPEGDHFAQVEATSAGAVSAILLVQLTVGDDSPDQIHLVWTEDPATSMTVVWQTASSLAPSQVEYRESGQSTWSLATGDTRSSGVLGVLHEATITGLTPATDYEYQILGSGTPSPVLTFRTAPAPGPADFDFVYVADTGIVGRLDGLTTGTQQVIDEIAAIDPLLILAGGDFAYFNTDTRFPTADRAIDAWFRQMQPIAARAPMMPTYGNHEIYLQEGYNLWTARFPTPPSDFDGRRNFSFDVGDVHFISVFATLDGGGLRSGTVAWLDADMTAAEAAGARWIIPFMHVAPFSDGTNHPSSITLREELGPVFEAHDVQVVLTSHDQSYERTYPIVGVPNAIAATSTTQSCYSLSDGITWVKVSPGGKLSNISGDFSPWMSEPAPSWTAFRDNTLHHFAHVRVLAEGTLEVDIVGLTGSGAQPTVIDTFRYTTTPCDPELQLDTQQLEFSLLQDEFASASLALSTSNGSAVTFEATSSASWLTVSPDTGTTNAVLDLEVDTTGLPPGSYSATVDVTSPGLLPVSALVTLSVGDPSNFDIMLSFTPDRANPMELAGAVVAGDIRVFTLPDAPEIDNVTFWVDHPDGSGTPIRVENSAPYDLMGSDSAGARAYDTQVLDDGEHSITASLLLLDGSSELITAYFYVVNDAPALSIAPAGAFFQLEAGNTDSIVFDVTATDGSAAAFAPDPITESWITVTVLDGTTPGQVQVDVDSTGLPNGVYDVNLRLTSAGYGPDVVPVRLTVGTPGLSYFAGDDLFDTSVEIVGEEWWINGQPIYQGQTWTNPANGNTYSIEGLMMNARLVQGAYDDLDGNLHSSMVPWDPQANTEDYIENMAVWQAHGLRAFNLCVQGGKNRSVDSSQVDNNPYGSDGRQCFDDWYAGLDTPHARYLQRIGSIIRAADDLGMVVELCLFYWGQDERLADNDAVLAATDGIIGWVLENGWTNVIIEVCNEASWQPGGVWAFDHTLLQTDGSVTLMQHVKSISSGPAGAHLPHGRLLVSVSGNGGYVPTNSWIAEADYVIWHGNGQGVSGTYSRLGQIRSRSAFIANPKPIYTNEQHTDTSVIDPHLQRYASWGYHGSDNYQRVFPTTSSTRWTVGKDPNWWNTLADITDSNP